ncbi:hypothetical protein [Streptomyces sp. NPDC003006]
MRTTPTPDRSPCHLRATEILRTTPTPDRSPSPSPSHGTGIDPRRLLPIPAPRLSPATRTTSRRPCPRRATEALRTTPTASRSPCHLCATGVDPRRLLPIPAPHLSPTTHTTSRSRCRGRRFRPALAHVPVHALELTLVHAPIVPARPGGSTLSGESGRGLALPPGARAAGFRTSR